MSQSLLEWTEDSSNFELLVLIALNARDSSCRALHWTDTLRLMSQVARILPNPPKGVASRQPALPYEPVCALFRRFLHANKLKFTPERAMILDTVLRQPGLFEAERLVSELGRLGHRVSRATAYRTLSHLQDAGVLKQVFFNNRLSYYEVIAGRQAYDYLVCVVSGKVIEFNSEKLRKLCEEIASEYGFAVLSHQFQIFGLSPESQAGMPGDSVGSAPVQSSTNVQRGAK